MNVLIIIIAFLIYLGVEVLNFETKKHIKTDKS